MTLKSLLESFEDRRRDQERPAEIDANLGITLEAARAEGYEAGYASGWEDAQNASTSAQKRVAAEFERNIETLAFTYHEAVDLVRGEVFEFIEAVVERILPPLLPEITKSHIRDALRQLAESRLSPSVELVASADCFALVEDMLDDDFSLNLTLVQNDDLAPNQVFVRFGAAEEVIDPKPLLNLLRNQLNGAAETSSSKEIADDGL